MSKLVPLNAGDSYLAGADCRALAVAPEVVPTVSTGFFGTYSLWMDTFLSLDIVGRALDLPQSNVSYPL